MPRLPTMRRTSASSFRRTHRRAGRGEGSKLLSEGESGVLADQRALPLVQAALKSASRDRRTRREAQGPTQVSGKHARTMPGMVVATMDGHRDLIMPPPFPLRVHLRCLPGELRALGTKDHPLLQGHQGSSPREVSHAATGFHQTVEAFDPTPLSPPAAAVTPPPAMRPCNRGIGPAATRASVFAPPGGEPCRPYCWGSSRPSRSYHVAPLSSSGACLGSCALVDRARRTRAACCEGIPVHPPAR
jgi:hypothetical protein